MDNGGHPTRLTWVRGLLNRYEGPLTRYAARLTGDLESARDVVQETFLRLCAEGTPPMDGHVARWLYTVCRSRALDVRRKESRMQALSEAAIRTRESDRPGPAGLVESQEGVSRVLGVLALLPESQQEVIRLRFQNGLSYKEIAEVANLSVGNVGYLIHTAIKTIRKKLSDDS